MGLYMICRINTLDNKLYGYEFLDSMTGKTRTFKGEILERQMMSGLVVENMSINADRNIECTGTEIDKYAVKISGERVSACKPIVVIKAESDGSYRIVNGNGEIYNVGSEYLAKYVVSYGVANGELRKGKIYIQTTHSEIRDMSKRDGYIGIITYTVGSDGEFICLIGYNKMTSSYVSYTDIELHLLSLGYNDIDLSMEERKDGMYYTKYAEIRPMSSEIINLGDNDEDYLGTALERDLSCKEDILYKVMRHSTISNRSLAGIIEHNNSNCKSRRVKICIDKINDKYIVKSVLDNRSYDADKIDKLIEERKTKYYAINECRASLRLMGCDYLDISEDGELIKLRVDGTKDTLVIPDIVTKLGLGWISSENSAVINIHGGIGIKSYAGDCFTRTTKGTIRLDTTNCVLIESIVKPLFYRWSNVTLEYAKIPLECPNNILAMLIILGVKIELKGGGKIKDRSRIRELLDALLEISFKDFSEDIGQFKPYYLAEDNKGEFESNCDAHIFSSVIIDSEYVNIKKTGFNHMVKMVNQLRNLSILNSLCEGHTEMIQEFIVKMVTKGKWVKYIGNQIRSKEYRFECTAEARDTENIEMRYSKSKYADDKVVMSSYILFKDLHNLDVWIRCERKLVDKSADMVIKETDTGYVVSNIDI